MSRTLSQTDLQARNLARRIAKKGLQPIALLLLEPGRPLALLTAQIMWMAQPVLSLAWQPPKIARWAHFLEQPGSLESLIKYIEESEE